MNVTAHSENSWDVSLSLRAYSTQNCYVLLSYIIIYYLFLYDNLFFHKGSPTFVEHSVVAFKVTYSLSSLCFLSLPHVFVLCLWHT